MEDIAYRQYQRYNPHQYGNSMVFGHYSDSKEKERSISGEIEKRKEADEKRFWFNEDYAGRYIGKETFDKFKTVETQQHDR